MKNTYIIVLAVVMLCSCADQLDIQPQQSLAEDIALNSDPNVKKALAGAYDGLSGYNNPAGGSIGDLWGGDMQTYSELLAADGEISWVGSYNQPKEIFGKKMLTNNSFIRNNWTGGYYTINIVNNVLEAIDKVNEEDRDRVKGEALWIRGVVYFELVRFWGHPYSSGNSATNLGVPIVLKATHVVTSEDLVSRNTVEEVYQQALSDLTTAESLLPEANDIYASKATAAAVLSRVYLQMGNFTAARDAADRVIQSGEFELVSTYPEAFNNESNSSEDVFALQVSTQDGDNNLQTYWSVPDFGGRDGDVEILQKHLDLYEPGDARRDMFYFGNGAVRSGKWQSLFTVLPVIRLSEMYLTRAEANFRLGTSVGDEPLNDINILRLRVNLPELTLGELTLNAIIKERKLELAHEGHAIHDIKRLQGTADGYGFDANQMVFPVPQREITTNPNLVQNPGYQ